MKYCGWLVCGLLLWLARGALAEPLRVDALRLAPEAPWQRGDPAREREDGVYLLEWPIAEGAQGVALQVALPLQATPLKVDAEAFYRNLRKKWAALYGKRAEIGEIDIGAVRWLACRRPSADGDASVFQLATARQGRAYSLLAFAPARVGGLPKPVHDLLAGANFDPATRPWVFTRFIAAQPGREALDALVQVDAEHLGQSGMLTGYGVEYRQLPELAEARVGQSLRWFMDGFEWRAGDGQEQRQPVFLQGLVEVAMPTRAAGRLAVSVRLASESNLGMAAEISRLDLCAPTSELDAALTALQRGARAPLDRLAVCPGNPDAPPVRVSLAQSGAATNETLDIPLPLAPGLAQVVVIAARPPPVGDTHALGQDLSRHLGLYFVYAPE